jgi:ribosomal protein S27E
MKAIESQGQEFPVQCYNCDHKYKAAVQASLAPTCPKCGKIGAMPQEVEK